MTNPDERSSDDKRPAKQDKDGSRAEQPGKDKAPGEHDESAYPNDDYWENGEGKKSRVPPDEAPEPDNGYRWNS